MPDVALMIEGQHEVDWERWRDLVRTASDAGFDEIFRSDHFTNPDGPPLDSLELWTSLTWIADHTDRIDFGPLVTPMSFRHPVSTARMAKEVDALAGGRLTLGLGAGWQEREHETYGFDLLDIPARFDRFEEGLAVVELLLRREPPVSFDGEYFHLDEATLLPRPERDIPILVGGNGPTRTLPLAAEYADEWNGVFLPPDDFAERNERLDTLLEAHGRDPSDCRRSLMTQVVFGRDEAELADVTDDDPADLRELGIVVGTATDVAAHLDRLDEAGADRVMLQWLDVDDTERMRALGEAVC